MKTRVAWRCRFLLLVVAALFPGCAASEKYPSTGEPLHTRFTAREPLPSYAEAVRRYNENAAKVDRLWSRAVATIEWMDEKGERRIEQGDDCFVVYVAPDRFALSLGKLGKTLLWAGCDAERYWVLNAQDPRHAYVGRHEHVGKACTQPLPMVGGVHPRDVMRLMGVEPINPELLPDEPAVEWLDGQWMIEPPGMGTRLLIDPKTGFATRIDLIDGAGVSRILCRLSHVETLTAYRVPTGGPAKIATRMTIELPDGRGAVRLTISNPTDGRADDRINDRMFDFDRLRRVLKISDEETTSLDRDCE